METMELVFLSKNLAGFKFFIRRDFLSLQKIKTH